MDLPEILAGIGAIISAGIGIALLIHELRRKERKTTNAELHELTIELGATREELITCRTELHARNRRLADLGEEL